MLNRVALYLQDAHDIRQGLEFVRMLSSEVLRPYGRQKAAWCGMRLYRWRPMRQ
jgi:hypothetical protein